MAERQMVLGLEMLLVFGSGRAVLVSAARMKLLMRTPAVLLVKSMKKLLHGYVQAVQLVDLQQRRMLKTAQKLLLHLLADAEPQAKMVAVMTTVLAVRGVSVQTLVAPSSPGLSQP